MASSRLSPPTECLIGMGSNLGDRQQVLDSAVVALREHPRLELLDVSPWYGTAAIGGPEHQGEFLNGTALLRTSLTAAELLTFLHQLESRSGRQRIQRWAPRPLDLDLLIYGTLVDQQQPDKRVPHPWMAIRPFVLRPAVDVAPQLRHPQLGMTMTELWQLVSRPTSIVTLLSSRDGGDSSIAAVLQRCPTQPASRLLRLPRSDDIGREPDRCVESMHELVDCLRQEVRTSKRDAIIVDGWWDQSLLEFPSQAALPATLLATRRTLASTVPQPNVIIGLLTPANRDSAATYPPSEFESRFDRYLSTQPQPSPFLKLRGDTDQLVHDISAVLSGLADTDLRPAG